MPESTGSRAWPILPVVGGLGSVAALWVTIQVALQSAQGQLWDERAMRTVFAGREAELNLLSWLGRVSIGSVLLAAVVCVVAALMRGRLDLALAALVVIGGANVTTQVLKHALLARPDFGYGTLNSMPSGHTTVIASGVAAAILVVHRVVRHVLALGGAFVVTWVGSSTIVASWHRPADIITALAVVGAWTAAVGMLLRGRWRLTVHEVGGSLLGAALGVVSLVAMGVRPVQGWDGFVDASLVLGAVALVTALFVMLICAVSPRAIPEPSFHVEPSPVGVPRAASLD